MKLKDAPIQRKLQRVILLTCITVLLLIVSAYLVLEYYSYRKAEHNNLITLGKVIASNSSGALAFDSQKDANEILGALKANPHIVIACLYDKDGNVFVVYPQHTKLKYPSTPGMMGYTVMNGYIQGFTEIVQEKNRLGTLYLKSDLEAMYDQLRHYAAIGLLLLMGSLVVAYFLSRLLQQTISEPILALELTAKAITENRDYSVRAAQYGEDEMGSLTRAFNDMLTQIQFQNREIVSFNQNLEMKIKERTAALQEQKDFVETIINSSVDLVAVLDTRLNYIMINKKANEYYTINRDMILGRQILDVFPQMKDTIIHESLLGALKGEYIHDNKYRSPITHRTFENFYIPLKDGDEKIYGVLLIGHDITNLMHANEQLENLNAELVKSNRDLEQFAYVASHDLQEPLRKIQTFTQLMQENSEEKEKQKVYQQKIAQAAARMQNLIRDVLSFSRISRTEEAFAPTDLNVIMENIKNDFELIIREKHAVINYPVLPVIRGIPLQLFQLFSNLISNSLKYNDQTPVINISFEKPSAAEIQTYAKLNPDFSYIKFTFSDNGIGFEHEYSERIFNVFQRLHGKQTYSGTGIGLAICKKIVENHEGTIFANAEPKKGATFTVIIPG
jgi:PAS domain S-box-containing protein